MTLPEAIATQPAWIGIWINVLSFCAFVLPVSLLIWRACRGTAAIVLTCSVLAGLGVGWMFGQLGYVKLLGLPHVLFWTPAVIYLYGQMRRDDLPGWPRRIMMVIFAALMVSLVFDYVDVIRYALGERAPLA